MGTMFKKTPTESEFFEKGTLTPLEFELAGNQLISASPIWEWQTAVNKNLISKELTPEKQFLSATIYSNERLKDLIGEDSDMREEAADEDGFVQLKTAFDGIKGKGPAERLTPVIDEHGIEELDDSLHDSKSKENSESDDELEDGLDDSLDDIEEEKKPKKAPPAPKPTKSSTNRRTYKFSITYDFYYNTPRLWIQGTDSANKPLTEAEIYEDIMSDYKGKTVTMEKHPHLGRSTRGNGL